MSSILVVEDERIVAMDLQQSLFAMGYQDVGTAVSAEDCLRKASAHPPDLVLMDIRIEGPLDGVQTAEMLRERWDPAVIFLTAYADQETLHRAKHVEPDGYLLKPTRTSELRSAVEIALYKREKERKQTSRSHAARRQWLASLSTLARGVAHEINNPLTYVLMNTEQVTSALERLAEDVHSPPEDAAARAVRIEDTLEDMIRRLLDAQHGAERIAEIVRDLVMVSAPQGGLDSAGEDVADVLRWALRVTAHMFAPGTAIDVDLEPVPRVCGNRGRLGQVFFNLLTNAAQAIEPSSQRNRIAVRCRTEGSGSVVVEVEDNGCGIDPQLLPRIFDPFCTTRPPGDGMGLGLFVCHGVVESLGGEISVESVLGSGSKFRVSLPTRGSGLRRSVSAPQKRSA